MDWTAETRRLATDLASLIRWRSAVSPSDVFLRPFEPEVPPVRFADLEVFARGFADFLGERGMAPGDRVAVLFHNSPLLALVFLATVAARRVFVPLNPKMSAPEIEYITEQTRPGLLVADARQRKKLDQVQGPPVLGVESEAAFLREIFDRARAPAEADAEAGAAEREAEIIFTSGSTGRPKGVVLTHANLLEDSFSIGELFGFTRETRFLTACPLFHNSGQVPTTLVPLWCGGSTSPVRSDMGMLRFWHFADRARANWSYVMPAFLSHLCSAREEPASGELRGLFCGGAVLSRDVQERFEARFSVPVFQAYGLTETTSFATCEPPRSPDYTPGSVGVPLSVCDVRIEKDGLALPAEEPGQILVRGTNLFREYLHMPDVTADRVRDGWLHTGDLGYLDKDGRLFYVDRLDSMIVVGGENIYPSEVERLVPRLDGVEDAILSSVSHPILGRELVLVYELRADAEAAPELWRATLGGLVSSYKVPRRFVPVQELGLAGIPRAPNGKILRRKLQDLVAEHCGGGAD